MKESKNSSKRSSHIVITKKVWIRMPVCYNDLLQNKEEKKLWRAGAYLRVSREDGKERESDSIDSQRKVIVRI